MRLIDVHSMRLVSFVDEYSAPDYAILSHVWGEEEVSFSDIQDLDRARRMKGFEKIRLSCDQAKRGGLDFVWVDTCCIDKSSSAELSEAINSMFEWYRSSNACYAFLDTPTEPHRDEVSGELDIAGFFQSSPWFSRGWTLQELIAPDRVEFFGADWVYIGSKVDDLTRRCLSERTTIPDYVLVDPECLETFSIAQRMSWAAKRETTRVEDRAYSLLGLLKVNMPLLYGEGHRAFTRLQEEIIKVSSDESLLAWPWTQPYRNYYLPVLALDPDAFSLAGDIRRLPRRGSRYTMTNAGLEIQLLLLKSKTNHDEWTGILNCHHDGDLFHYVGLELFDLGLDMAGVRHFCRTGTSKVPEADIAKAVRTTLVVGKFEELNLQPRTTFLRIRYLGSLDTSHLAVNLAFFKPQFSDAVRHIWSPDTLVLQSRLLRDAQLEYSHMLACGFLISNLALRGRVAAAALIPFHAGRGYPPRLHLRHTDLAPEDLDQSYWENEVASFPIQRYPRSDVELCETTTSCAWGTTPLIGHTDPTERRIVAIVRHEKMLGYKGWVLEIREISPDGEPSSPRLLARSHPEAERSTKA